MTARGAAANTHTRRGPEMSDRDAASELLPEVCALLQRDDRHPLALGAGAHVEADLGLDSVTVMELVAEAEDRFDVSVPLNALPEVRTVGDFARMVAALRRDTVHG